LTLSFFHNKQLKKYSDSETEIIERLADMKEHRLKNLLELSLKSLGEIPHLEEPSEEQLQWVENKMKAPAWTWQRRYEGIYFTGEQNQEMGNK
jgi:hypothetical protein